MNLTMREKVLLGVLGGLFVLLALWGVASWASGKVDAGLQRVEQLQSNLVRFRSMELELSELGRTRQPAQRQPLVGYLETLARQGGVADRIQLNLLPQGQNQWAGVEVKMEDLTLDEVVLFMHQVESADQRLIFEQFEVAPAFRGRGLLRLSARILGSTP